MSESSSSHFVIVVDLVSRLRRGLHKEVDNTTTVMKITVLGVNENVIKL